MFPTLPVNSSLLSPQGGLISHIGNLKCFHGHVKKKKGEMDFEELCCLTQCVQNTVISARNQHKRC